MAMNNYKVVWLQ